MSLVSFLVCTLLGADGPQVTVYTSRGQPTLVKNTAASGTLAPTYALKGQRYVGRLQTLTPTTLRLTTETEDVTLPVSDVMDVEFAAPGLLTPSEPADLLVTLVDRSQIECDEAKVVSGSAHLTTRRMGEIDLKATAIRSIRFLMQTPDLDDDWQTLLQRSFDNDILVVRKKQTSGAVLDHLDGVVGDIGTQSLQFLLDGDAIPVKRAKVFGVVYHRRDADAAAPLCRVRLNGQDSVLAKSVTWNKDRIETELNAGTTVAIPVQELRQLDLTVANTIYLSDIAPRNVQYTPYFDITWKYRRDRNLDGGPLRLGNKTFARGLCIHSRTLLQYRLGGAYRRLLAVMGIDEAVGRLGDVHVTIRGDGKKLLEADVRGTDEPRIVDLDLSNVHTLDLLVDFGSDLDIADHLDLADGKVIR